MKKIFVFCCLFLLASEWIGQTQAHIRADQSLGLPFVAMSILNSVSFVLARKGGKSSGDKPKGGHDKNARESTRDKHERADARRAREQERARNNPNRRG